MASGVLEARRINTYAHTLFEAALAEDRVFEDLKAIDTISSASQEFLALLRAMLNQGDFDLFDEVAATYKELVAVNRAEAGAVSGSTDGDDDLPPRMSEEVVGVHVTTAVELDDELREIIKNRCEADLRSKVFLIEHIDPTIIGGIILSARGMRRDASVTAQLDLARRVLTQQTNENGGVAGV